MFFHTWKFPSSFPEVDREKCAMSLVKQLRGVGIDARANIYETRDDENSPYSTWTTHYAGVDLRMRLLEENEK